MSEKIKELSIEEVGLLTEMKDRCLNKGLYIDEKAKEKFEMLCHLEDFSIKCYELQEKIDYLKKKIENKDKWCQLIADIGFDYDGYRQADSLMSLIDELVKYALYSRDDHDFDEWVGVENEDKVQEV